MSGQARAELICKAKVTRVNPNSRKHKWDTKDQPTYEGYCGNVVRPDLVFDESYDAHDFEPPDGWHVEVGTTPDKTIVRCPDHCNRISFKDTRIIDGKQNTGRMHRDRQRNCL